jgi:hypothetical protein
LGAPNGAATACERIKHTPTPHQYDYYFTRIAVAAFSTLLPFGLLGALPFGLLGALPSTDPGGVRLRGVAVHVVP